MTRQKAILKAISVVVAITFFWTNCAQAGGVLSNHLGIDAKEILYHVFPEFRVLVTPIAFHNAVKAGGLEGLSALAGGLDDVKVKLVQNGVIPQKEADKYLAMQFDDPATGEPAYYYFNKDGCFIRVTPEGKEINDKFYTEFLRLKERKDSDIVSINGDSLEKFVVTEDDIEGINICLKRLYGYTLYDLERLAVEPETVREGKPAESLVDAGGNKESMISAGRRYEELIRDKENVGLTLVYDYAPGKEKAFSISVPKEEGLTEEEKAFVAAYLAVYIYNRLTSIGAQNLQIFTEDLDSIRGILDELESIFMRGESSYSARYPMLSQLWLITNGSKIVDGEERGLRMQTFYGRFNVEITQGTYIAPAEEAYNPEKAEELTKLERVRGTYIGLDVGGSNMKVTVVKDGKMVHSKKYVWDPSVLRPAWKHTKPVEAMLELAMLVAAASAKGIDISSYLSRVSDDDVDFGKIQDTIKEIKLKLGIRGKKAYKKYIDGIGISWPDIISENKVIGGLTGKVIQLKRTDFESTIKPLAGRVRNEFGINTHLINDGDVGAFVAGVKLGMGNIIGISLGTSTGVGYLDENGEIRDYITDMSHVIMAFDENDSETAHKTTGIRGTMQKYLSQQGMFRLAKQKGIDLSGIKENADKLEELQRLYEQGDSRVEEIVEEMAVYLADGVQQLRIGYFLDKPITTFVLSGRTVESKAGESIVARAQEILSERNIDVNLVMADELDPNWDPDMRDLAQAVGAAYFAAKQNKVLEKNRVIRRSTALGYILRGEDMDLIPELPEYPRLPSIKEPVFNSQIGAYIKDVILGNPELANVVFGFKKAGVVNMELTSQQMADSNYALLLMKHITGVSIKIFKLAKENRYCVYDENYCRALADSEEAGFAATRLGLEYLIKKDIAGKRGKYYQLTQAEVPEELQKLREEISSDIILEGTRRHQLVKLGISELYFPTYERPDALDRALTAQTNNLELFGHKDDITMVIVDSSPDKVNKDTKVNYYRRNIELVEKFRKKGFKIKYIGFVEVEQWKERIYRTLLYRYTKQYRDGSLDPRVREALFTSEGKIKPSESDVEPDLLHEVLFAALSMKNIAGKRTLIQAISQGKKIASADDDALPIIRIPNRKNLNSIFARRKEKINRAVQRLYEELSSVHGITVNNDSDFERLLAELDSKPETIRTQIEDILEKYYAYSPDGQTGLVPTAGEQIIGSDVEHRLRFDRILHEDLSEYLVVSEDTGTRTYKDLPEIDDLEYYDWVPVDYLGVFDETLGVRVGSPTAGRVFRRDLRGIAGDVDTARPGRRVLLATSHFSGDRDNSAEGLFTEAMGKWERDGHVTTNYLQQVVRKAVFVEVDGSVSNLLHNGNQFCFNTTSLDNTEFPIPTTGAWLRIEEPLQFSLIRLVMLGAMAWSRTVGGHERCPGQRRPKLEMQLLWEECAMVLYRELDKIAKEVMEELKDIKDPAERIRYLGQKYLESASKYTIPPEEEQNLRDTCTRIAQDVNRLYAFYEAATDPLDKEELLDLFGKFDESPFGFIKQFSFAVYEFNVQADGHTAKYTKRVPIWRHQWEPARLVESYEWEEVDSGEVDLSGIDWENSPVVVMPDSTRVELTPYNKVPRQIPNAGYSFRAVVADAERQADFIQKAQEVVQRQFMWDGQQLLIWADILKVSKNFYEIHELMKEKEEFRRRREAGTLTRNYVKGLAVKAADVFMDYYNATGEALIEAVEIIGEIAVLPDPSLAKASSKGLFGGIVESLSDSFSRNGRSANYRFYPVLIQMAREVYPELDSKLNQYGIPRGEEGITRLIERMEDHRKTRQYTGSPGNVQKIFILSRVTFGADMEINSIVIKKLHEKFPNAEIVFLGKQKSEEFLSGFGYVRVHNVDYKRSDPMVSDLSNWVNTVKAIEEETEGMAPGSYIIADPDSRVARLGLLPLIVDQEQERASSFFYESTLEPGEESTSIGEDINRWLNETFDLDGIAYPEISLKQDAEEYGNSVYDVFLLKGEFVVSFAPSAGGNYSKSMAPADIEEWQAVNERGEKTFEERLLLELINRGARIVMDKGLGADEEARVDRLIAMLRANGISVVEIDENTDLSTLRGTVPQVVVFKGGLGKLAALIKRSSCYIGYDSQGLHMAVSVGVPCVELFRGFPNDLFVKRWTPLNAGAVKIVKIDEKRAGNHIHILKETLEHIETIRTGDSDTAKKAPNTEGLGRAENIRLRKLLGERRSRGDYESIPLEGEVMELIRRRAPPKFVTLLESGAIELHVHDMKDAQGRSLVLLPRRDEKNGNMGIVSFYESSVEGKEVISITRSLYDRLLGDTEKWVYILTQIIIHELAFKYLGSPRDGEFHSQAVREEPKFSTEEAQKKGISDLNQFILDYAVEIGNKDYLYNILAEYNPKKDIFGTFKIAVCEAIKKVNETLRVGTAENPITNKRDLLVWYRANMELHMHMLYITEFVDWITEKIEEMLANGGVSEEAANGAFFKAEKKKGSEETVYLPRIEIDIPGDYFEIEYGAAEGDMEDAQRQWEEAEKEEERRAIALYNCSASGEARDAARRAWESKEAQKVQSLAFELEEYAKGEDVDLETLWKKALAARRAVEEYKETAEYRNVKRKEDAVKETPEQKALKEAVASLQGVVDKYYSIKEEEIIELLGREIAQRHYKEKAPVMVSVVAGGGAGKTTVAGNLAKYLETRGLRVGVIGTDPYLYPSGLRYIEYFKEGKRQRVPFLKAGEMYDDEELLGDIDELKKGGSIVLKEDRHGRGKKGDEIGGLDIIILEGCFAANSPAVRERTHICIGIADSDDEKRFTRKIERDTKSLVEGGSREYPHSFVMNDFSDKQFHEQADVIRRDILEFADFILRQDSGRLYVNTSSKKISVAGRMRYYRGRIKEARREYVENGNIKELRSVMNSLYRDIKNDREDGTAFGKEEMFLEFLFKILTENDWIPLNDKKDIAREICGFIRDKMDRIDKDKLKIAEINFYCGIARDVFMYIYGISGELMIEYAKERTGPVDIIAWFIGLRNRKYSNTASRILFRDIIEKLADTFTGKNKLAINKIFARIVSKYRLGEEWMEFDQKLIDFGIPDERRMIDRLDRVPRRDSFNGRKKEIKKIFLLSRITYGADVAVTSVVIERMKKEFPDAEIVLVGKQGLKEFFGNDPRVTIKDFGYDRGGSFGDRMKGWLEAVKIIEDETVTLEENQYLAIDCDTRISQLGVLPMTRNEGSYYFISTSLSEQEKGKIEDVKKIGDVINAGLDGIFGAQGAKDPTLYLSENDVRFAEDVKNGMNVEERYLTSVSFGVGANVSKQISDRFELALVKELLDARMDSTVILDKGVGEEIERADEIVKVLRASGKAVVEISVDEKGRMRVRYNIGDEIKEDNNLTLPEGVSPDLITFQGTLGKFASLISISNQYIGYDSCFQHVAGAFNIHETVIFAGYPNDVFVKRWTPLNKKDVLAVKADTLEGSVNENKVIEDVIENYYKNILKQWFDEGRIDEELYNGAVSLIDDKKYGSAASIRVKELIKNNDVSGVGSFVKDVLGRRRNIDRIRDLLNSDRAYTGYDVLIISSSTPEEAKLQEETLNVVFSGSGRDVKVLSIVEEGWQEGAGNFLATLAAYQEARIKAKELYDIDLDEYWKQGKKICMVHNGGVGQRANPLTVSYDNSRGAQKMIGEIELKDGRKIPITLLTLTILSNFIYAGSNNGAQLDVYWASQIFVGNKDAGNIFGDEAQRYLLSTYAVSLPPDASVTESDLYQFGTWEGNDDEEAVRFYKQEHFGSIDEWDTFRSTAQTVFRDIGSQRYSRRLLFSLLTHFHGTLVNKDRKIDFSTDIVQPLMVIISAFIEEDISGLSTVDAIENKLEELGKLDDLKSSIRSHLSSTYYREIIGIFLENMSEITQLTDWMKIVDIGDSPYWWTFRSPKDKLDYDLAMTADLLAMISDLGDGDVTIEDRIAAEDMRRLRDIEKPVQDLEINGKNYSLTVEEIKKGVWIEGVFIKGSIVRNCILLPGSRVVNSVLEGVIGKVDTEFSELVDVAAPEIVTKGSIVHNVVQKDKLGASGRSIAGVYRLGIHDSRYEDMMTVINVPIGLNAKEMDSEPIEDGVYRNLYSFKALREMSSNRAENKGIRNNITKKVILQIFGLSGLLESREIIVSDDNLVETVWGGHKVEWFKGIPERETGIGESWDLSGHRDHPTVCTTANGLKISFPSILMYFGPELMGNSISVEFDGKIPTLLKYLNSEYSDDDTGNLSVQAHPNDDYARVGENDSGKIESWYILDAEEDAVIYLGFKEDLIGSEAKKQFRADLERWDVNIAQKYLNAIPVGRLLRERKEKARREGTDVKPLIFYIPHGTIHAIGKGVLLVEVQQSSGVTYRVWDWNRKPKRKLHIDKCMDILNFWQTGQEDYEIEPQIKESVAGEYQLFGIVDRPCFSYDLLKMKKKDVSYVIRTKGGYREISCTKGYIRILNTKNGEVLARLERGDTAFISAFMGEVKIESTEPSEALIYWYDKKYTKTGAIAKKSPGTPELSHEEWDEIMKLIEGLRNQGKTEVDPIPEGVKEVLRERAPPTWESPVFVDFHWLIENDKIMLQIDDLGDTELYPRKDDEEGTFSFIELLYKKEGAAITEEQYEKMLDDDKKGYEPFYVIHLTKKTYELIKAQENREYLLAQTIIHEFIEYFISPPKGISRHRYACQYEGYFNKERTAGVSDLNKYLLERAAARGSYRYLFGILANYNPRRDQDGTFLNAVYEAIDKLSEELNVKNGAGISTVEVFTVWYRYMFEHVYKRADNAVFEITKIIDNNDRLKKLIEDSGDRWAIKYSHEELKKIGVEYVYIPQCPVDIPKDEFVALDIEYEGDIKEKAEEILECIKRVLEEGKNPRDIMLELNRIEVTTGGRIQLYEVFERKAEDEHMKLKELLEKLRHKYTDESLREEVVNEIKGMLYNLPVVEFWAREIEKQRKRLKRTIGVGVIASGGTGKTTVSTMLKQWLRRMGMKKADEFGADIVLHPGGGFRYEKTDTGGRVMHIFGPGIYNDRRLLRRIRHIKNGGSIIVPEDRHGGKSARQIGPGAEVIIVEGVYVGLDRSIAHEMDIEIALLTNEKSRVPRKLNRDLTKASAAAQAKGREGYGDIAYVIKDTVDKLFHEKVDGVKRVALGRADYIFAEELDGRRRLYIRSKFPARPPTEESLIAGYLHGKPIPLELECGVQDYAWGHTSYIQQLTGEEEHMGKPWAELWIGAHPKAPAMINIKNPSVKGIRIGLDVLIEYAAKRILGRHVMDRFKGQLPYLFKVLAAGKPLSIQAHPNRRQAERGFEREEGVIPAGAYNRNYKDPNHKPELICALTEFYALNGFRGMEEIARVLNRVAGFEDKHVTEFADIMPDFNARLEQCGSDRDRVELLRELYSRIMNMNPDPNRIELDENGRAKNEEQVQEMLMMQSWVDNMLRLLVNRLRNRLPQEVFSSEGRIINWTEVENVFPKNEPEYWVLRADSEFCNENHRVYKWYKKHNPSELQNHTDHKDVGIISIYLLNLVPLSPGEAMYLPAGELHAYLDGVGLEIMANSDNVLRGGLTPKHVDVPELLDVLTFNSGRPRILYPRELPSGEQIYDTPATEFRLSFIELNKGEKSKETFTSPSDHSADSLLVLDGEVEVRIETCSETFRKGQTFLVPAEAGEYTITAVSNTARVYRATPGIDLAQQGPVGKNPTGSYEELWEAGLKDGELSEGAPIGVGKGHSKYGKIDSSLLKKKLDELVSVFGPGILAVVDAVRVVDNIGVSSLPERQAFGTGKSQVPSNLVPYAMMIKKDGRNILLLDVDAFDSEDILYIVLEHELKESIMTVIPCENDAVRELTTNFMSLKLALERGIKFDKDQLEKLGVDLQFFEALEVLQAMAEVTDRDIIAVAIEHMRGMPYYRDLFQQFKFAGSWESKVKDAENRYKSAIDVFNDIMEARLGVDTERRAELQEELKKTVSEVEINIKVIRTFTGKQRVIGLEELPKVLQKMIGVVAKQIHSVDRLAGQVTKATETKYILLDSGRLEELKAVIGEDEYERIEESLSNNNYQICTEVPDGVVLGNVIRLVDPVDLENMPKVGGMLYLPMPYTRSSLYMAANVVEAGGVVGDIDSLVKSFIRDLYSQIVGESVSDDDLVKLFTMPWEFLPAIRRVIDDLNSLRTAVIQIEKAA